MVVVADVEGAAVDADWGRAAMLQIGARFDAFAAGDGPARLDEAASMVAGALRGGRTIFWCGNGGSAGDAQHLAAELIGRFGLPGRGYPSIALTTDSSNLTAIANDFGYEQIFVRQAQALVQPGDVLVGISTSGRSANVVLALQIARDLGAHTIALTGPDEAPVADHADVVIHAPGDRPTEIQTLHIVLGQLMLERAIERAES